MSKWIVLLLGSILFISVAFVSVAQKASTPISTQTSSQTSSPTASPTPSQTSAPTPTPQDYVFIGDSHIRFTFDNFAIQHSCQPSKERHDADNFCEFNQTDYFFVWSVGVIPLVEMAHASGCDVISRKNYTCSDSYLRRNCEATLIDVLRTYTNKTRFNVVVTNIPQFYLQDEGLHDGKVSDLRCMSGSAPEILTIFRNLLDLCNRLVLIHHLDLTRWGGPHLDDMIFVPLEKMGVDVIRMHDAWTQSGPDSHMRKQAYDVVLSRIFQAS